MISLVYGLPTVILGSMGASLFPPWSRFSLDDYVVVTLGNIIVGGVGSFVDGNGTAHHLHREWKII